MWITRFARLPLASLLFKGQDTEHTTGKWPIEDYYRSSPPRGWARWRIHPVGLSCSTFTFRVWIPCLQILSGMAFLNASPCRRTLEGQFANRHFFGVSLYSKRLETELKTKLQIKKQHFLYLLSVITASRESLPVGFVSKVLVPGTNSKTAKRKVRRALGSVSTLLPIHDDCTSFHSQVS